MTHLKEPQHEIASTPGPLKLIRYAGLKAKGIDYCRQQIRRKVSLGEFPQPITLDDREGKASKAWIEQEIDAWIMARAAKRQPVRQREAVAA